LTVPIIAALLGMLLLDEALNLRLTVASIAILGGVGLVVAQRAAHTD
jgi:drug/metabolite transporter (DMT)-like permease